MNILVINGPNLNMLGVREPSIYGHETLEDVSKRCQAKLSGLGHSVAWRQSNDCSELVGWVQSAGNDGFQAIVINPAALGHYSIDLRDSLLTFKGKKVEVHLSNTYKREKFRKVKITTGACDGVIEGLGTKGYELALLSIIEGEE